MPILDKNGKPISSKKPIIDEIAVHSIYDKYSSYPSNGLTPVRLATLFREADAGNVYRQMELYEEMEEKDPHLFSQLQTRKNAVIGLDFDVLPFSDDTRDKEIAKFVTECIDGLESIEDIFLDILDAIGKGFSVNEILWAYDEGRVVIEDIKWKHQKKFLFDDNDYLRVMTAEEPMGILLPENKFVVHKYKAKSGHPSRAGVLRVCAWMYLFKNYDVKDWVAFAEVYGMPLRVGTYNANTTKEDKEALMMAVSMLGSDAAGIISDSTKIDFHEASKSSSQDIYQALASFCNAEMSKAILGQTLTSEVGDTGSYAASKTHAGVRQDLLEADCKALAQVFLRDVIRPLCYFNFGETKRLPYLKFHYEPPEDLKASAETYSILIKDMSLPIAADHVYDKFGIPKPQEGQEILKPPAAWPQDQIFESLKAEWNNPLTRESARRYIETLVMFGPEAAKAARSKQEEAFALSAKPRAGGYQKALDALADNSVKEGIPSFVKMFEVIVELMNSTESLEELKEKLPEAYAKMDTTELEDLLQRAMFVADLLGRSSEDVQAG